MRKTSVLVVAVACLLAGTAVRAQGTQSSTPAEANAAYEAKDWAKAAKLYEELAKSQTAGPRVWYRLGVSLGEGGETQKAVAVFEKGVAAGLPPQFSEYGIACAYAASKNMDKAFEFLSKVVQHGYADPDGIKSEAHFAALQGDAKFLKLVEQATRNQKPCADAEVNRQFDFWVGEWNVETTQGGVPSGQSKIELILGDCVVQENWQSNGNPYSGKSYNIYNGSLKRWEQYWVDNVGGNIFFYGGLKDGVMDYWTDELPQPDGTKLKRHLQFFKLGPDKVRQYSQGSTDNGKTWRDEYDFTYNRKK
jgi:tetratricopeptide (TPR) repeat protein